MEYTDRENYFSIYMKKKANSSQKKKKYGQAIKNSVTTHNHFNQNKTLQSIIFDATAKKDKNSMSFLKQCKFV